MRKIISEFYRMERWIIALDDYIKESSKIEATLVIWSYDDRKTKAQKETLERRMIALKESQIPYAEQMVRECMSSISACLVSLNSSQDGQNGKE